MNSMLHGYEPNGEQENISHHIAFAVLQPFGHFQYPFGILSPLLSTAHSSEHLSHINLKVCLLTIETATFFS